MRVSRVIAGLAMGCLLSVLAPSAEARVPRRPTVRGQLNKAVKNIEKEIKTLEKELNSAQEEYLQAQQELARAHATYQQAQEDREQAEESLQGRVGPKVGLIAAMSAVEDAEQEHKLAADKLVSTLQENAEFQQLIQQRDETEARLVALRKDKSAESSPRAEVIRKAANDALEAREALRERIDGDPAVKPFRQQKLAAEELLKVARQKFQEATKSDPELRQAEKFLKQSRDEYRTAQRTSAQLEEKISAMQERLVANRLLINQ